MTQPPQDFEPNQSTSSNQSDHAPASQEATVSDSTVLGDVIQVGRDYFRNYYLVQRGFCNPKVAIGIAFISFLSFYCLRAFSAFEFIELRFYDFLMRSRLDLLGFDKRFLIIEINDDDFRFQQDERQEVMQGSLSHETLADLLEHVQKLEPVAVGLDVFRDYRLNEELSSMLKPQFEQPNLFGVCKTGAQIREQESERQAQNQQTQNLKPDEMISGPPLIASDNIGFADFVLDRDFVLRRIFLAARNEPIISDGGNASNPSFEPQPCNSNKSFSLLIAEHYLAEVENIETDPVFSKCPIMFNNGVSLPDVTGNRGGYQRYGESELNQRFSGCQMMFNYRAEYIEDGSYTKGVYDQYDKMTLKGFLEIAENPESFQREFEIYKNRIVLIGVNRNSLDDKWLIPFRPGGINHTEQLVPGVFIQANMIGQIIDIALGQSRPIRTFSSWWLDLGLFILFSGLGARVGYITRYPPWLVFGLIFACFISFLISWLFWTIGGIWLALLPHTMAYLTSSSLVCLINLSSEKVILDKLNLPKKAP